jgi:hypothetical protein
VGNRRKGSNLESLKFVAFSGIFFSLADDEKKVLGEDEGDPLAVDAELLLHVAQEVAEVDVEDLTV